MSSDPSGSGNVLAVILAGPSGAGKTTLRDRLLEGARGSRFMFSVSMTTRARRSGERDGVDYHFVDAEEFRQVVSEGGMLEHATVHGDLYGTPRSNLDAAEAAGRHLLLDIDVQGARQVREALRGVVSIFILPPTADEMLRRLHGRASESDAQLRRRYESALEELAAVHEFDYVVVNDDLGEAVDAVRAIAVAEESSVRRAGHSALELAARLEDEIRSRMQ